MSIRPRLLAAGLLAAAGLLGSWVPTAGGATTDPQADRVAVRAKKAELARQLNTLTATEDELVDAADALDDEVRAASSQAESARQAAAAADAELAQDERAVSATEARIQEIAHLLVGRAVSRYMAPRGGAGSMLAGTDDLAENARRQTLVDTVAIRDRDLLDQLGAAREDLRAQQQAVEDANSLTLTRRRQTQQRLAGLQTALDEKEKMAAAVEQRRQEVLQEIDEQAKAEAELTRIINLGPRATLGASPLATSSGCIWPANGNVTSEYGTRWGRLHSGIDVAAPTGTPIWAAKAGQVIFVGREGGYGNVVIIAHTGDLTTLYAHMSRFATSEGAQVTQGQLIGYVGTTGDATGAHVHFETRYGGVTANPRSCLG